MQLELIRITSVDEPCYADAMKLYAQSFPYHEQRENDSQIEIMSNPAYHFDMVFDEGRLIGMILNWQTKDFIYVEHFCIMPDLRGKGYGKKTLALLATLGKTVILEIDPPVDEISIRRRHFYETAGYVENGYSHIHPPYHAECHGHELVIMSYPQPLSEKRYQEFSGYLRSTVMNDSLSS